MWPKEKTFWDQVAETMFRTTITARDLGGYGSGQKGWIRNVTKTGIMLNCEKHDTFPKRSPLIELGQQLSSIYNLCLPKSKYDSRRGKKETHHKYVCGFNFNVNVFFFQQQPPEERFQTTE